MVASALTWQAHAASDGPRIGGLELLDADRDAPVAQDPVLTGTSRVLDLTALGARHLSVRATTVPARVGSVRFVVDGNVHVENHLPYLMAGDGKGGRDVLPWTPTAGTHAIDVTAFTRAGAQGEAGPTRHLTLTVRSAPARPTPTPGASTPPVTSCAALPPTGHDRYVSPTGDDRHDGTSRATAWRTLQHAMDRARPGDTVLALAGVYAPVTIRSGGRPGAPVTLRGYPCQKAEIRLGDTSWNGVHIVTSYVVVQGLTVTGNADRITLAYALSQKNTTNNPKTSGNCVSVEPVNRRSDVVPAHIDILDMNVSKCSGGGISAIQADYIRIERSRVVDSAWYNPFGASGISLLTSSNSDRSTACKNVVAGNYLSGNEEKVPWKQAGKITDGNAIIIDSNNEKKYTGCTLIENNLVVKNGGRGIHVFDSSHVRIYHNTTYHNALSPAIKDGELTYIAASDVVMADNIAVPVPGHDAVIKQRTKGNGPGLTLTGNYVGPDPGFVDVAKGDFRLRAGSPAVDAAAGPLLTAVDITGRARPAGRAADLGAYESR